MKFTNIARILFFLLPLTFGSGCVTKALCDNGGLEAWREPASPVNLHLFDAKQKNDLLVVYDEYSERGNKIHTRAYWLNENQARVNQRHAPYFVNTNLSRDFSSVPVFYSTPGATNRTLILYAVVETNKQSFTLYFNDGEIFLHDLPVYNDGKGRVEKVALTPIAVTADLTIVGTIIGSWYFSSPGAYWTGH